MNIELRPGEEMTIGRSRDGKILIVQRESGTSLVETNDDRVRIEVFDCDGSLWKSPLENDFDRGGFWAEKWLEGRAK